MDWDVVEKDYFAEIAERKRLMTTVRKLSRDIVEIKKNLNEVKKQIEARK